MVNDRAVITNEAVIAAARAEAAMSLAQRVDLLDEIDAAQPVLVAEILSGRSLGIPELHLEALLRVLSVCFLTLRTARIHWRTITTSDLRDALDSARRLKARYAAASSEADRANALPRFDASCEPLIAYILGEAQRCAPRRQSAVTEFMLVQSVMLALCVSKLMADLNAGR